MIFSRTSGASSFNNCRNKGSKCSIVLGNVLVNPIISWYARQLATHLSFPRLGARPLIWVANAARTCWDVSVTSSFTQGRISRKTISLSMSALKPTSNIVARPSPPSERPNIHLEPGQQPLFALPPRCPSSAAQRLTPNLPLWYHFQQLWPAILDSEPLSRTKHPLSLQLTWTNLSAIMYRTLQDLSEHKFRIIVKICVLLSSGDKASAMAIKSSTVNNRTESYRCCI